jgi:hypothetical protein
LRIRNVIRWTPIFNEELFMGDHMGELYQKLMREPRYRARAAVVRRKTLEHRVFSIITHVLLLGLFGPASVWELREPDMVWYGGAAAFVALYGLAVFLLDWPALTMDLRARHPAEAGTRF